MSALDVLAHIDAAENLVYGDVGSLIDYYDLEPPDSAWAAESTLRHWVAGALRARGHLVEAHEVIAGRRYDDPDGSGSVLAGITGAIAVESGLAPRWGSDSERQVGDDIAIGVLLGAPLDPMQRALDVLGPEGLAMTMFGR